VLSNIEGNISVEGHTDNLPISSAQFTSNWDLSASRALSVTHELLKNVQLDSTRFVVVGHADTRPFKPNTSPQNRASNRRVEIIIRQGTDVVSTAAIDQLHIRGVKESGNL
jgi:chemotaxis protein MotB